MSVRRPGCALSWPKPCTIGNEAWRKIVSVLDIARGAYVRSPKRLRDAVSPALSLLPVSFQYGKAYRALRADIARSRIDPAFTQARRLAALRALLAKAHRGSPSYRTRIESALGTRIDFRALDFDALTALPVFTKDALRGAGEAALAVPPESLDRASTSGSSGQPLLFWLDKDRSPREFAFVNDVWSRTGYREGDARCVLRGLLLADIDKRPFEWEAGLKELRCSPFAMTEERMNLYLDMIDRRGIAYLHGYPSAIEILCRHMWRTGRRPRSAICGVFPISEPLYSFQRDIIRAVLPEAAIVPFYGLSERVLFAGEEPGVEGEYEFEPLYGHAELLDEHGLPVTRAGERGRIVGTGFLSTGMPFIRYETGDSAELVEHACEANGWRLRVSAIMPRRKPEFLIGAAGNRIVTPTIVPVSPDKFFGVSEFQFYQDMPGRCLIKVVPAQGCSEAEARLFLDEMQNRVGSAIRFELTLVGELAGNARGKRPVVDQRLDLAQFTDSREPGPCA
jgi:phenylacetate-coenzyme A ligase PaaK-like adenylate-forming protein